MIKILIVDDSAFMRKLLSDLYSAEPDFIVVDTARNGLEAVEKVKRLKPDLVTMDVEMPIMDGIKALEVIMKETPTPVVMISSLTKAGAEATLCALELGAVDFIAKSAGIISSIAGIGNEILAKSRIAVNARVFKFTERPVKAASIVKPLWKPVQGAGEEQLVAIGTSTGGPRALQDVITKLPGDLPCGVVIVQHMPPGFTKSLSERLNSLSSLTVKEAEHNDVVRPGLVLIAPGDYHMTIEREGNRKIVKLNQNPPIGGHRPSVDPMMESVAKIFGQRAIGVILTGMGHDGAQGIKAIKQQQGYTIAEDESTTVVFGMPKSAIELGVVDKVAPISAVAAEIVKAIIK